MPKAPRAFLCHAFSDQSRFVEPFAKALRNHGVEVFYAEWDIGPGDRLWDRISAGIEQCETFVLVASPVSLERPWVKEEIGGGLTAKLADGKRFVVIVLDECEEQLPVLLRGRKYLKVPDVTDFSVALKELVNAAHGYTVKPPLGDRPEYVIPVSPPTGVELTHADWRVLSLICVSTLKHVEGIVRDEDLLAARTESGLDNDAFADSIDILSQNGYLKLLRALGRGLIGRGIVHLRVTPSGFEEFLCESDPTYPEIKQRALAAVVNRGSIDTAKLIEEAGCSPRVATHIAQWLELHCLAAVRMSSRGDGHFVIALPAARLRRMVTEGE